MQAALELLGLRSPFALSLPFGRWVLGLNCCLGSTQVQALTCCRGTSLSLRLPPEPGCCWLTGFQAGQAHPLTV